MAVSDRFLGRVGVAWESCRDHRPGGARLIDGVADEAKPGGVVEGELIKAVGGTSIIPPGARRIALEGATLLPGLIDAHVHPTIWDDDYQTEHFWGSSAYEALRGLLRGF